MFSGHDEKERRIGCRAQRSHQSPSIALAHFYLFAAACHVTQSLPPAAHPATQKERLTYKKTAQIRGGSDEVEFHHHNGEGIPHRDLTAFPFHWGGHCRGRIGGEQGELSLFKD